jgi:hypothetical protein
MVRTQVQLTEQQAHDLKWLAARKGVSMATLIREGIDLVLGAAGEPSRQERKRQALASIGRFRSGVDLGVNHDEYFVEAIAAMEEFRSDTGGLSIRHDESFAEAAES